MSSLKTIPEGEQLVAQSSIPEPNRQEVESEGSTPVDPGTVVPPSKSHEENLGKVTASRKAVIFENPSLEEGEWEDLTDVFIEATNDLDVGQLVSVEGFTLWEAMCAIEMMDLKMDGGMEMPKDISAGKLKVSDLGGRDFTARDIIATFDQLLSLEMSWIAGNLLCQTIFTCVCLHEPYMLRSSIMRACAIAVMKSADLIRDVVTGAHVYAEEDFVGDTMGLPLGEEVQAGEMIDCLMEAHTLLTGLKRRLTLGDATEASFEPELRYLALARGHEHELIDALLARIKFAQTLFRAIEMLWARDAPTAMAWTDQALSALEKVQATTDLGSDVSDLFDPYITRKLFTTMPPKPILLTPMDEAMTDAKAMLLQFKDICSLRLAHDRYRDLDSLLHFHYFFSGRSPGLNILVRSLLHANVVADGEVFNEYPLVFDIIRRSIIKLGGPAAYKTVDRLQRHDRVTHGTFLEKAEEPVRSTLKLFVRNRARQHRALSKLLKQWDALQVEAQRLELGAIDPTAPATKPGEAVFSSAPPHLSRWVLYQKLNLMSLHLTLGLELELFSSYELPMVACQATRLIAEQRDRFLEATAQPAESPANVPEWAAADPSWATETSIHHRAKLAAFQGLFDVARVLRHRNRIPPPNHPSAYDERVHFNYRFRVVRALASPTPLSYEEYVAAVKLDGDPAEILREAAKSFDDARDLAKTLLDRPADREAQICDEDQIQQWQALVAVCEQNAAAATALAGYESADTPSIDMVRAEHPYIHVIKLKPQ